MQWFNYMMFVGTAASGAPSTEFALFDDFINLRGDYAAMRPFSNFVPTLKRLLHFILVSVAYTVTAAHYPLVMLFEKEYLNAPLYAKIFTIGATYLPRTF